MSKPRKVILKDGSSAWEAYVREGGRGSKEVRKRFLTSKAAQDFIDDFRTERKKLLSGDVRATSFYETTFQQEAEFWLDNLKHRSAFGHHRRCEDLLEDFNKTYGSLHPNKITPDFLSKLQKKLKEREARTPDSTLSNSSVNKFTETICAVLNFSASQRRIPFNPVAGFKKLPRNSPEMLFWDEQEAGSFLAWASAKYVDPSNKSKTQSRKNYVAYLLALNTGMRAGEIWGLKPYDLQFRDDGDTIFVRRQLLCATRELAPLKGGMSTDKDKSRHVPCSGDLRKELEALIQFNKSRPDRTIFESIFGNFIHHDSFSDRFARDQAKWGGRQIRFHDLRHTAATLMLSKGIDVKTVSEILGHEDIGTTMIYVHLLGDKIKQVSKSFTISPSKTEQARLHIVTSRT